MRNAAFKAGENLGNLSFTTFTELLGKINFWFGIIAHKTYRIFKDLHLHCHYCVTKMLHIVGRTAEKNNLNQYVEHLSEQINIYYWKNTFTNLTFYSCGKTTRKLSF